MHAQAASLSDQDIADIAAYLQAGAPETRRRGCAKAPKQVESCVACHGGNGLGVDAPLDPKPPVLAGQHGDYLEQALIQYRNGRRQNVVMRGMAQMLKTDADVRIAADYFAAQASPLTTATTTTAASSYAAGQVAAAGCLLPHSHQELREGCCSRHRGCAFCGSRDLRRPPAGTRPRHPWRAIC